jgi:hypothetical protein
VVKISALQEHNVVSSDLGIQSSHDAANGHGLNASPYLQRLSGRRGSFIKGNELFIIFDVRTTLSLSSENENLKHVRLPVQHDKICESTIFE